MALICDTGGIYPLCDADDAQHEATRTAVEQGESQWFPWLPGITGEQRLMKRLAVWRGPGERGQNRPPRRRAPFP